MNAAQIRKKFINFFISKGHKQLPSVSLVPEDDPTILFTPAGMSPLVRYLRGESHPLGKRLCSIQKCVRTDDIDQVGDLTHFTFFEMLGNWSLGDYFKTKAIEWSFEFITNKKWLNFDPKKIYISVFEGDKDAPQDREAIKIWQTTFKKAGLDVKEGDWKKPKLNKGERIFSYSKKENWWGPAGQTGPCGPSTEMFYDTGKNHDKKYGSFCHPNCNCGRFFEFWNDVFMEYNKKTNGQFELLKQKNVDTGMGLERVVALTEWLEGKIIEPDPFLTNLFDLVVNELQRQSNKDYKDYKKEFRVIIDHIRTVCFIIANGVEPSNKGRGYILRRLLRRGVFYGKHFLGIDNPFTKLLAANFIGIYKEEYKELKENELKILKIIESEEEKFFWTINKGLREFKKVKIFSGKTAFRSLATYGFPVELSIEEAKRRKLSFSEEEVLNEFNQEFKKHQQLSRTASQGMFKGGLAGDSKEVVKLHTATHLLHQSLRLVLSKQVSQVGSNITKERLRFDFTYENKLTPEQIRKIEALVNKQIKKNSKVTQKVMSLKKAKETGALAFFGQKYPNKVKVYSIGDFSKEVCGGPHVDFTGELGKFIIKKEESSGAGKRRIYAVVKDK